MSFLLLNLILFVIPLFICIKKDKKMSVNTFILGFYTFFALTAIIGFDPEIYQWGRFQRREISIWPFIFFHICFWLLFYPLWRINSNKIEITVSKSVATTLFFISVMMFCASILINYKDSLQVKDAVEAYNLSSERGGIKAWSVNLASIFSIPANLLMFFYLSKNGKNKLRAFILLFLILIEGFIRMKIYSSRGISFFLFGDLIVCFLLFANNINRQTKRIFSFSIVILLSLFIPAILLISQSRFGSQQMFIWIISYFCEPFINWATVFWDSPVFFDGNFTFGDLFGWKEPRSRKIPVYLFKTFVGSLYIDFNIKGTLLFLVGYSLISRVLLRKIKPGKIQFQDAMVYFILIKVAYFGIFNFQIFKYYQYFVWIILYILISIANKTRLKKS